MLNLGLQSVGLARELVAREEVEREVSHCNSMSQVRELATKKPFIKEALIDSMAPVKVTLTDITQRLELKGEKFVVHSAAVQGDIAEVWGKLNEIDPAFTLSPNDKITHQKLTPNILSFIKHCCHQRHYFFEIKKCGDEDCNICLPPRLPSDKFLQLDHLPDPMPGQDGHYKKFSEVFRTITVKITGLLFKISQRSAFHFTHQFNM